MNRLLVKSFFLMLVCFLGFGCAGKKHAPLDTFVDSQKTKMSERSAYIQADFDFWAALYEPTQEDMEALRAAWIEHGQAFPESKPITEVETELRKTAQKTAIIAVFMTSYELADLRDKSLGWTIHPIPIKITELSENDVVLRTLMPVKNQWARYFLVRFSSATYNGGGPVTVSNRNSRVILGASESR